MPDAEINIGVSLSFQVTTAKTLKEKMSKLVPFLRNRKGPSIVYVTLQKQAEDVAVALKTKIDAMVYHAGLKAEQRDAVQNAFMASKNGVVIATIAFGMGIDKGALPPSHSSLSLTFRCS